MNSRALKITVSLLLTVSLLCCSVSVFAEEENPLLQANDQTVAFLVWQLLKSWGIDVQFNNISEFTVEVQNEITNWIWDYLEEQPSIESIIAWIADWTYGTDFWGNLVVNHTLMDDVRAFANWLVNEKELEDNSTQVLNPTYTVNGATVFYSNVLYESEDYYNNGTRYIAMSASPDDFDLDEGIHPFWCILVNTTYNTFYLLSFKLIEENYNYPKYFIGMTEDGVVEGVQGTSYGWQINKFGYSFGLRPFFPSSDPLNGYGINLPTTFTPLTFASNSNGGYNMLYYFLESITDFDLEIEGNNRIVVTEKIIPVPGEDYTSEESMTIIDGQPTYQEIDWPEEIKVSNLPAIVSTGTIENPEVDQIYTNIPAFIQMAGDTMNGFKQIIFRMPDEVLIVIYAVLSVGVLFGFLRIMREH